MRPSASKPTRTGGPRRIRPDGSDSVGGGAADKELRDRPLHADEVEEWIQAQTAERERLRAARHPDTPEEDLRKLSKSDNIHVAASVGLNPATPEDVVLALIEDEAACRWGGGSSVVRLNIARRGRLSEQAQQKLRSGSEEIRRELAKNPASCQATLIELADSPNPLVRKAVAVHPQTPAAVLYKLVDDDSVNVLLGVWSAVEVGRGDEKCELALTLRTEANLRGDALWDAVESVCG